MHLISALEDDSMQLKDSNHFLAISWSQQHHFQPSKHQEPSPRHITVCKFFSNSIITIYASLAPLIVIFVIIIMFSSWPHSLIVFLGPLHASAMVRVSTWILGSLCTGKIGPWIRYHDAREAKTSWLVPSQLIYHARMRFLSFTGI